MIAAILNLQGHAGYVHWHFIDISVPNLIVIAVMLLLFLLALVVPFPVHHHDAEQS